METTADRKRKQHDLVGKLQSSKDSPQVVWIVALLESMIEDEKHALISTDGNETLHAQGRARALGQLITMITRPITPIKPPQQTGE